MCAHQSMLYISVLCDFYGVWPLMDIPCLSMTCLARCSHAIFYSFALLFDFICFKMKTTAFHYQVLSFTPQIGFFLNLNFHCKLHFIAVLFISIAVSDLCLHKCRFLNAVLEDPIDNFYRFYYRFIFFYYFGFLIGL